MKGKCPCCAELEPLIEKLEKMKSEGFNPDSASVSLSEVEAHIQNAINNCQVDKAIGRITAVLKITQDGDGNMSVDTLAWSRDPQAAALFRDQMRKAADPSTTVIDLFDVEQEVR